MHATTRPRALSVAALVLLIVSLAASAAPIAAQDASPVVSPATAPAASEAPPTMCESLADLRLYVGFLRDQSLGEGDLVPILVGTVASLAEARTLLPLVGDEYRPLVEALVGSLEDLRAAVGGFGDAGTVGTGLVEVGESIVGIGTSLDALTLALQEPCPEASVAPGASPTA